LIFVDTNVLAETLRPRPEKAVIDWLIANDAQLAISTIVVAEIAFGIEKIRGGQRSPRLQAGLDDWRKRLSGRIYSLDEEAALIYGRIAGAASRSGRFVEAQDGMIAAIALRHTAPLATRNISHFDHLGLSLINPWS
jgi:predicted nucleic acid-binding protein